MLTFFPPQGPFYLTKLLLPILVSTAQTTPEKKVRVVNTSSIAHVLRSLDFATFKDGPKRRKMYTDMLYAQSKYVGLDLRILYSASSLLVHSNPGDDSSLQ